MLENDESITVRVNDRYQDGDIVYLHYFNEETIAIILDDEGIVVKDRYVTFTIEHCSMYYLSTQKYEQKEVEIIPDVDSSLQTSPTVSSTVVETRTIEKTQVPSTGDSTSIAGYIVALTIRKIKRK